MSLPPPLPLKKGVRTASNDELESGAKFFEDVAVISAVFVVLGLILETCTTLSIPSWISCLTGRGAVAANILVTLGVLFEVLFGILTRSYQSEIVRRSNEKLSDAVRKASEANERAAKADLARAELEAKFAPRSLTKEQYEKLQTLKGQIKSVIVAHDVDWEPSWFAHILAIALQRADINVGIVARDAHVHGTANFVCDRRAFSNPGGVATNGEPLVSVLNEAGIPISGVLSGRPGDLPDSDPDTLVIVIGNRIVIPVTAPYVGPEIPAPPMTMLERIRDP